MSKIYGKEFDPCMRTNNLVMMRINPEPVVLTLEEIVDDLTYRAFDYSEYGEILATNKKQMKAILKDIANYRAYYLDGREICNHINDKCWDKYWNQIKAHVLKLFPDFEVKE